MSGISSDLVSALSQRGGSRRGVDPLTGQRRPQPFEPIDTNPSTIGGGIASFAGNIAQALIQRQRQQEFEEAQQEAASGLARQTVPDASVTDVNPAADASRLDPRGGLSDAQRNVSDPQASDILELQGPTQQALSQVNEQRGEQRQQLEQALLQQPGLANVVRAQNLQQDLPGVFAQQQEPQERAQIITGQDELGQQVGLRPNERARATIVGDRIADIELLDDGSGRDREIINLQTPDGRIVGAAEGSQRAQELLSQGARRVGANAGLDGGEEDRTQRQRQIAELRQRDDIQEMADQLGRRPRAVAADFVDGRIEVEQVPETGKVRLLDKTRGRAFEIPIQNADALQGLVGDTQTGQAGASSGQPTQAAQGQTQTGQGAQSTQTRRANRREADGDQQTAQRLEQNRRSLTELDPDDLFGPEAVGKSLLNNTLGLVSESLQFPKSQAGKVAFRTARELAGRVFRSSGRVSNAEQERILKLLPEPNAFFENPDTARPKINAFIDQVQAVKRAEQAFAEDPSNSTQLREAAQDRVRTIDRVIESLSRVEGVSPDGADGSQQLTPERIREMPLSQIPDVDKLTDEQRRALEERLDEEGF